MKLSVPHEVVELLWLMADSGGVVQFYDGHPEMIAPAHVFDQATKLGLVEEMPTGGFGFEEQVKLTRKGWAQIGLPATPTFWDKIKRRFGSK